MKRYFEIWLMQAKYSFIRDSMFKGNFLLWMLVEFTWFAVNICFVKVIFSETRLIAGWSEWEMILLTTTSQLITVVYYTFFIVNLMNLSELIRTGKLDFYLAQPASPQFLVSTRVFDTVSLVNMFPAIFVVFYAMHRAEAHFTAWNWLWYVVFIIAGVMIHYALVLMLVSLAFWMTRTQGLMSGYYQFFNIARTPREAFRGFFRLIFTWALPFLLIANVPARTLLHGPDWEDGFALIGIATLLVFISSWVFNTGLKRYGSASS